MERGNAICAHQVEECLPVSGSIRGRDRCRTEKTEMAHTFLSRGKVSWFLPSACFTYSNAGNTSAALPSRTRLATPLSPSCNRARTDVRQSVHSEKSTSRRSIYVVRARRRAIFRQALKARGKGERTRWMSARVERPGELVTSVCNAIRFLCSVRDDDLLAEVGRGIWTVTESGPESWGRPKSQNKAHVSIGFQRAHLRTAGPIFVALRTYLG